MARHTGDNSLLLLMKSGHRHSVFFSVLTHKIIGPLVDSLQRRRYYAALSRQKRHCQIQFKKKRGLNMDLNDLTKRIDQLILEGKSVLETKQGTVYGEWVDSERFRGFRSAALSFIERVYGVEHSYYKEFYSWVASVEPNDVEQGIAILESVKKEVSGGWLFSIKGLVVSEIFTDFLGMAQYLLAQDCYRPAAVVAGSVLEEHLRQLCIKNGIGVKNESEGEHTPRGVGSLSANLTKAGVYGELDQKAVSMWLDLSNKAAYGKCEECSKEQVQQMLHGITEFFARITL
jgi:hypothetical protein